MGLCEQSLSYVRAIAPYQPGKPIAELAREMGLDETKIVKLASNENPFGISPKAKAAIKRGLAELARYPDGNAFELKAALSRRYAVPQECIVVGNGSNDLLELAAGAFLAPGRAAVYSQHAFAVYPLATQARGAEGIVVPAKDYAHDLEAMLAAITPETRLVFIANPNNPTGTFATGMERLERGLKALGLEFIPSCANFLTFRVARAGTVYEKLLRLGVIVRPLAGYDMPDHLRVTVGTPKENQKFLKALRTALDG